MLLDFIKKRSTTVLGWVKWRDSTNLAQFFIATLFFLAPFFQPLTGSTNYIHLGFGLGLGLLTLVMGINLVEAYGRLLALALIYFSFQAIYIIALPNRFSFSPSEVRLHFSYQALYFLLPILLFPWLLLSKFFHKYFPAIGCLNASYTVLGAALGFSKLSDGYGYSGILDYPSVNGLFTVTCYFLLLRELRSKSWIVAHTVLTLLAVLASKSSTPLGAFIVGVTAFNLRNEARVYQALFFGTGLLVVGFLLDPELFNSQGRLEAWGVFMSTWADTFPVLFGSGPGTFGSLAIETQIAKGYMVGEYYLYLHNEWLQIFYETGLIGFALTLTLYAKALYNSFKRLDYYTFAALSSFGAGSLLVFPLRYFWGALLGAYLLSVGLRGVSCDIKGHDSRGAG